MNKVFIEGDRLVAFLIINGKVYQSDLDHQDCLEEYYADFGIKSEFDYTNPDTFEEVCKKATAKTYALKCAHEAYGFDLFDESHLGYVLLAHDRKTLENNRQWALDYAKKNNSKVAYWTNGWNAVIEDAA